MTAGAVAARAKTSPVAIASDLPVRVVAALAVLTLGLPILVLVVRAVAGGALVDAAGLTEVIDALVLSLVTTSASLVLSVGLGLPLAYVLARRSFRGQTIVETLVDLPIVLPPSVAGLALLLAFGRRGLLGEPLSMLGLTIPFTTAAVILAQTFVSAPFFIRSARTGFATVDRDLEDAARVDGGSERQVFRSITIPLAATALAAGLVLTWARCARRIRRDHHVRGQCRRANADVAAASSMVSSRAATSTRPSRRRRCSSWRRSACSWRSGCFAGDGRWTSEARECRSVGRRPRRQHEESSGAGPALGTSFPRR